MEPKTNKKKKTTYKEYAEKRATGSPVVKNCFFAFAIGGSICLFGESLKRMYMSLGADDSAAGMFCSVSLIFLSVLLTGFGYFDKIARVAGAGTLLPITGFANAMASPAIDAKSEGMILGVGSKAFNVAGPVILYGTAASVFYGLIYFIVRQIAGG